MFWLVQYFQVRCQSYNRALGTGILVVGLGIVAAIATFSWYTAQLALFVLSFHWGHLGLERSIIRAYVDTIIL